MAKPYSQDLRDRVIDAVRTLREAVEVAHERRDSGRVGPSPLSPRLPSTTERLLRSYLGSQGIAIPEEGH
jgi:hypothetical protein